MPENGARIVLREMDALNLADPGIGRLLFRRRLIEVGPRDGAVRDERLHAREVEAGELALRLRGGELRLLLPRVELDEHVALAHGAAGFEGDAGHEPGEIGADRDALHRGGRADDAAACPARARPSPRSS